MENKIIQGRLNVLREAMKKYGMDYYMIPTADFHHSEYVSDYFKVREYFSGFDGSNGTLLVWQDGAGLWTDGRYFIQAENQLAGTTITLFRMLDDGVPAITEFLAREMKQGQKLGFDGRVVAAVEGKLYEKLLKEKSVEIVYDRDPAGEAWPDRPALPAGEVMVLDAELTGKSVAEKLKEVRGKMASAGADGYLLNKLDDLMWLFNIRGSDVDCNPVALSYGYITKDAAYLFLQREALTGEAEKYFDSHQIRWQEYQEIFDFLADLPPGGRILVDNRSVSYALYQVIAKDRQITEIINPTELLKAMKNPVELENMEQVYLQDSVALTKFIYWLKHTIGKEEITEISAADHLERLRREIPGFLDLSFPTISGYNANAAMMHYEATPEKHSVLKPEGILLVDSGGQYLGGTTDVTRTIVLGSVSDEIKMHYTLVAAGMLQLTHAKWLHGCTGRNLDILARQPLWQIGIDYKCGTGHGIGYILNVHEGPQNIRWRYTDHMIEAELETGMVVSNEPGVYVEGSHGIRIENIMVVKNGEKNEYGQFMYFDTLTYVPIDMEAIEPHYLSEIQKEWLTDYQRVVYEKVSPYLNEDEKDWLRSVTYEITI